MRAVACTSASARVELIAAVTQPEYRLKTAPHTVDCLIEEDGGTKPIRATGAKVRADLCAAASVPARVGLFTDPQGLGATPPTHPRRRAATNWANG